MKRKYYLISVCLIGAMLCMAGCGKSDREDIEQDLHILETDTDDATQTDSGVSDVGNIPEHLNYTLQSESNNTKAVVDADVYASSVENMHVYEMTKQDMNEDTLRAFADDFFDNGEYEVVKPYAISSREELLNEQSYLNSLQEGREHRQDALIGYNAIVYYLDHYSETQAQDMQEGTLFYEVPALGRKDANGEPLQIMTCRMRGDVNGERWELLCTQDFTNYNNLSFSDDYYILRAYSLEPMHCQWDNVSMDSKLSNLCSVEDAQKAAEEWLEKMGYENMALLKMSQTYCDDMLDTLDGYNFEFGYSFDDIETVYTGNLYVATSSYYLASYNGEITSENATNQPYIRMLVCSNGVNGFEISYPFYMESEKISDQVECLSFDQVDGIARAYIQELLNGDEPLSESNTTDFDFVRLQYVTVQYEDKQCVMVPVWVYYGRASNFASDFTHAMFGVMAIDGSVIEMEADSVYIGIIDEE